MEEYKLWQQSRIGRDIDLGELVSRIRIAGAKRVEVNSTSYIKLTENQVARLASESIVYGGLEDD